MQILNRSMLCGLVVGAVFGASLVVAVGTSAIAAPDLATQVAKALKLANKANKNSKAALATAKQPGPAGPQGPKGDQGPSNGYVSPAPVQVAWVPSTNQVLASVPVTVGSHYVINSHVVADNDETSSIITTCFLRLAGSTLVMSNVTLAANGVGDQEVFALTGAGTASATGTAELRCIPLADSGTWNDAVITAIKVGSLN